VVPGSLPGSQAAEEVTSTSLAPDVEYLPRGTPKGCPAWLAEGTLRPTKRTTLSTWDHYDENDPLLESGLLGPVMLVAAEDVAVE
jgi:hypothetical protein